MEQVEFVDRDYTDVDEAKSDVRKKESRKVKLAEKSKKMVDSVFSKAKKAAAKVEKKEAEIEMYQNYIASKDISLLEYIMANELIKRCKKKKVRLEKTARKAQRKALRVAKKMNNNMIYKWARTSQQLDVKGIDRKEISNAVNEAFNNVTDEVDVIDRNKISDIIDTDFKNLTDSKNNELNQENGTYRLNKDEIIQDDLAIGSGENEIVTNGLSYGTYRLKKDEIVQDDLATKPEVEKAPAVIPEFSQFFDSISKEKIITEKDPILENAEVGTINEDIFTKINDSLNDENITSNDLAKLRAELEAERNKKNKLTEELEEKLRQAAIAEKEAAAALQEQKEKMKLVQNELEAYKEENRRLETQTQEVEESTNRQISKRQQSLDYINSLNEMIGSRAVNVTVSREVGRGGK